MSAKVRRVLAVALITLAAGGAALFITESASARPMPWRTVSTPAGTISLPMPWRSTFTPAHGRVAAIRTPPLWGIAPPRAVALPMPWRASSIPA